MTLRWVTSFKPLCALGLLAGQLLGATISGHILLSDSRDPEVKKKKDFGGVAVWLTSIDDSSFPPVKRHAEMLQKNKMFRPHLLVVQAGTTVDFPNLDPIFHNAFSNFEGQIFDIGLYSPGTSKSIRFDRAGIVRVFCNIHPSMSAVIVVAESPFFTVTDETGEYALPNVEPGRYELHFFHERATPETLASLTRKISVDQSAIQLSESVISEAGYLPVAHKNKYGQDYPPTADQQRLYPSPSK